MRMRIHEQRISLRKCADRQAARQAERQAQRQAEKETEREQQRQQWQQQPCWTGHLTHSTVNFE